MWTTLVKKFDSLIDSVTMYRLLLYYLLALLIAAIGLSFTGNLNYKAGYIALTAIILVSACWLINKILALFFDAPTNPESSILTGLILALIIPPNFSNFGFLFLLAAAGLAMASKYLLTINRQHIFNPAAVAVVLTAFGPWQAASWWVGTASLLPFVIIGGLLIARKVRREYMVGSYLVATTLATAIFSIMSHNSASSNLRNMALSSAVFFLGFVMLTEPYTSPTTRGRQIIYAVLVGVLIAPQVHLFSLYSTPELALIVGNVFALLVSRRVKLFPAYKTNRRIAADTVEFVFSPNRKFDYQPGQYMEWTLPHKSIDSRGSRRYFTLASSPTEPELRLCVKFYDKGSSFKKALLNVGPNTPIVAAQLGGDFVLPKDSSKKLVFIAGGIGITPFRSMVKYLLDKGEHRDITLLYSAKSAADLAYIPLLEEARKAIGLKTIYTLTAAQGQAKLPYSKIGRVSPQLISQAVPDFKDCNFYVSGTHSLVIDTQHHLRQLGVPKHQVKTDFFPGYA